VFTRIFHVAGIRQRFYAIGWQKTVRGLNVKAINWIHPDGLVEMAEMPNLTRS